MPYEGNEINGIELRDLDLASWRKTISWVGQTHLLLHSSSIRDNVTLRVRHDIADGICREMHEQSFASEFCKQACSLDYMISDRSGGLSVGQSQRVWH